VCPCDAIQMENQQAGAWYHSQTLYGRLFHAGLLPGQENSGKLVTLIKQQARLYALENHQPLILVDGPPGIGCPVISAFAGADLALIITEATLSGLHDLKRIFKTVQHFKLSAAVCINKADILPQAADEIRKFAREEGMLVVGEIPYDPIFVKAVNSGVPVTTYENPTPAVTALQNAWELTLTLLGERNKNEIQ
jgi:MinD superfamily P-loop ATPase